jgi:hypothetical protein
MVTSRKQDSDRHPIKQRPERASSEPNKIGASTPYDFNGKNLTPYGGLLPVITMLDKLGFQSLVEETLWLCGSPRGRLRRQGPVNYRLARSFGSPCNRAEL